MAGVNGQQVSIGWPTAVRLWRVIRNFASSEVGGRAIGMGVGLLALLVAISNDRSLRSLGAARWKRLQRLTYVAATLTALHGIAFQLMDRRSAPFIVVMLALIAVVVVFQLQGRRQMRTRHENEPLEKP